MEFREGYPKKRKRSRRGFLKLAGLGVATSAAAVAIPETRKAIGKIVRAAIDRVPSEDADFYAWLKTKRQEWETNERFQEGQVIEEPVVYNIEPVKIRSKPEIDLLDKNVLKKADPGMLLPKGEIVLGGWVPEPGGQDQSNRWLKFHFTDDKGKERNGYISAIYVVPKEEYEKLTGSPTENP